MITGKAGQEHGVTFRVNRAHRMESAIKRQENVSATRDILVIDVSLIASRAIMERVSMTVVASATGRGDLEITHSLSV